MFTLPNLAEAFRSRSSVSLTGDHVTVLHMVSHRNGAAKHAASDAVTDTATHAAAARGRGTAARGDVNPAPLSPAADTLADPVLAAAYKSIMEVGLRRTTMAEIARQAGISRMTLYRRYPDLNRLLSALLETELLTVIARRRAQVNPRMSAASRLTYLASAATADVASHPLIDRVLSLDPQELLPLIVERFGSTQQLVNDQLVEMIISGQPGVGDGSIRSGLPQDLALTILVVAQAFVFSHRAINTVDHDAAWVGELRHLIAAYLNPSISVHQ